MAGLRVPMRENKRTQAPGGQSCKAFALGQGGAGVPSLQAAEPARLFLPSCWAQGRHLWVDEEAGLQPLSAQRRRGPGAF